MATVALILVGLIIAYVMAGRGSLVFENKSGMSIEKLVVEVDGSLEILKSDFPNGNIVTLPFEAKVVKRIQISATLKDSILSGGTIEPGLFANLKARIMPDRTIDFGETRFHNSNLSFGDWESSDSP